jgi:hypothetical protein
MKNRKRLVIEGMIVALFFLPAPVFGAGGEPPASVLIDSLSHLYTGVDFDHEQHLDITDDCSACHHHCFGNGAENEQCARCHADSSGTSSVACGDCHVQKPFTVQHIREMEANPKRYHLDMIGLKAAYHLRCINCHLEMDAPSGCMDCHERTDAGDRFYHSGSYAPAGGETGGKHE